MDLPTVNPGDLIKADHINKISSALADNGRLTPVAAGAGVTLPADADVGDLHGYSLEGPATVNDASLAAGDYVFRKTATGWDYRRLADATVLTAVPDTTAPTAGTLASSAVSDTGFTLTASGASDNKALHSSPYAFSLDGGATWSAWQTSPIYIVTGRTVSTAYSCRHKVRDASANETTGAFISVTTLAAPPPTLPFTDDFTAADGTSVVGRTVGGFTWTVEPVSTGFWGASVTPAKIVGNKADAGVSSGSPHSALVDVGVPHARVTATISHPGTTGKRARVAFGSVGLGASANGCQIAYFPGEGFKVYQAAGGSLVQVGSNYTASGTGALTDVVVSIEYDGTNVIGKVGGVTIASGAALAISGTKASFLLDMATPGLTLDDFKVEAL